MVNFFTNILKDKVVGPILIFFVIFMPSVVLCIFFGKDKSITYIILFFLINLVITILIIEFIFLSLYKLKNGESYNKIEKIEFNKISVKPHPYLPYVYKSNFQNKAGEKINFPIKIYEYFVPKLKTNSLGFYNGIDGNKDFKKEEKKTHISCLGASTTGNYLEHNSVKYSYPLELEKILNKENNNYVVNNCAQGGYNSADILIRFSLQTIDTKPDIVIIYHAYNDIRSYQVKDFRSDYSNSRRNLGEVIWRFYVSSIFPSSILNFLNYFFHLWFPNNDRYSLVDSISYKQNLKIDNSEKGLKTYERNLQNLIYICKSNKIKVVLSTFCFYLYERISNDYLHIKNKKFVELENNIIRKLARENNLPIVDNDKLIEKNDNNFVDSIHFSHKGMRKIAENFAEIIKTI